MGNVLPMYAVLSTPPSSMTSLTSCRLLSPTMGERARPLRNARLVHCKFRSSISASTGQAPLTALSVRRTTQIAILNGASIFGRTLLNMLADRIGPLNVLWPVATVTAALMFVMFSVTTTAATIVFSIFYGFFSGARA